MQEKIPNRRTYSKQAATKSCSYKVHFKLAAVINFFKTSYRKIKSLVAMSFLVITEQGVLHECLLTGRELVVLRLVARGYANKQIATLLFVSTETVKKHLQNSYAKLNAHNKIEALRNAGLI